MKLSQREYTEFLKQQLAADGLDPAFFSAGDYVEFYNNYLTPDEVKPIYHLRQKRETAIERYPDVDFTPARYPIPPDEPSSSLQSAGGWFLAGVVAGIIALLVIFAAIFSA